ncbi:MAG TPA: histidine phosphatase family protein [Tepidisphaeraceae bacterium]|jgi:phosphohistidine phosphatase|nr:histidine phosphatase family protein [Tepidisphaeraceae bacterium]
MKLLLIRHAVAEDRGEFARLGHDDAQRPLTKQGQKRMRRGARGLHRLIPNIDVLVSSPLTRAIQTAEIVTGIYDGLELVQIGQLAPGKTPTALLSWIAKQAPHATIALVGHEPHLGVFVSWMLTGLQESFVTFKKGGACLLELDGEIKAGRAKLLWLLKASQLRDLA